MRILPEETQCMIIDMQERLMPAMNGRKACEDRALMLIRGLRVLDIPMLITQQYTKGLGGSIPEVYEAAGTTDYYDKRTFSCTKDEAILAALEEKRAAGRKNVLVCGTEAHVCVFQTCLDLKALGFQPVLVTDAIASRKKTDKKIALQRAVQEGILLTTAEAILFELNRRLPPPQIPRDLGVGEIKRERGTREAARSFHHKGSAGEEKLSECRACTGKKKRLRIKCHSSQMTL